MGRRLWWRDERVLGGGSPPAPAVPASIFPYAGAQAGGTSVVITGASFLVGSTVSIGGVAQPSIVYVSPTKLAGPTSAFASSGAKDVVVTNPGAAPATLAGAFIADIVPTERGASLKQWHKADAGANTIVAGKVSVLADLSGSGNSLSDEGNATYRPTLSAPDAGYRNRAVMTWPAAHGNVIGLSRAAFATGMQANGFTFYIVMESDNGALPVVFCEPTSIYPYQTVENAVIGMHGAGATLNGPNAIANKKTIIAWVINAASSRIYLQKGDVAVAAGAGPTEAMAGMLLGNAPARSLGLGNAKIAEVLRVNGADSGAQVAAMMRYLSSEWSDATVDVVCSGNSFTAGFSASSVGVTDFVALLTAAAPPGMTVQRDGHSGFQTFQLMNGATAFPLLTSARRTIVLGWEHTNEISNGTSAAQTLADAATWVANIRARGALFLQGTCADRGSFGAPGSAQQVVRATVNAALRANVGGIYGDALVDFAADPRLSDAFDLTYFDADSTHPNDAGHAVIAELAFPDILALAAANPA